MNAEHLEMIELKLSAFLFDPEAKIVAICQETFRWPYPSYLVLVRSCLGPAVIRCRIVNGLYSEARKMIGDG